MKSDSLAIESLNILLLSWGFDPERQGGIARFCIQLAHSLRNHGANVEMWGLIGQETEREKLEQRLLEERGIRTHVLPTGRNELESMFRAIISTVRRVRRQDDLYVSLHGALADLCGLFIKSMSHSTVIRTVHSEREWYKRPRLGRGVDNASARWLDGEIGVSSKISGIINQRRKSVNASALAEFIPPITNPSLIDQYQRVSQQEARQRLGIPSDKLIIGSVGRFTPQKATDILIRAAALLKEQAIDYRLYIVGEGPLENSLLQLIANLNLESHVQLLAPREEISLFLRSLDLYVSSSRWEGLSLSVLEATLCHLPIVSTVVSGTRDIERLLNVQLYKCNLDNPQNMAQKIIRASKESDQSKIRAMRLGSSPFNPDTVAARYLSYFASLRQNQ
jgi:glycosyltransferase involved in cell wall biosynthesis